MKDEKYFDKFLKSELKDSVEEATPSRDIFNEAWNKRNLDSDKYDRGLERMYFYMGKRKIAAIILGVFIGISALGLGVSPTVRAAVKTIFFWIDKEGNVVEERESDLQNVNSRMADITDSTREEVEKLFGFKIIYPEKVKNYRAITNKSAIISVRDVKVSNSDEVSEKIKNATDYNKLYEDLSKEYKVKFSTLCIYGKEISNNEIQTMSLNQRKGDKVEVSDKWIVKEVKNIHGIECSIIETTAGEGNEVFENDEEGVIKSVTTDKIIKPTSIEKNQRVIFAYNGAVYTVMGLEDDIDKNEEDEMEFVEEYIKILKNN